MTSGHDLSLEELVEFYDARDLLLGVGNSVRKQNLTEGFRRLKASRHPEARYVCSLFPGGLPGNREETRAVFEAQGEFEVALCYAGLVCDATQEPLKRAAEMGHPLAMGAMSGLTSWHERLTWARRASEAGDRSGWFALGCCLLKGDGCEADRSRAVSAFAEAARLGHGLGMTRYGRHGFSEKDPQRFLWMGRGSRARTDWNMLMEEGEEALQRFEAGEDNVAALLMIGRMVSEHKGRVHWRGRLIADARLVRLYERCMSRAKEGILCWMLCARRLGLYRDVSLMVGRRVWEERGTYFEKAEAENDERREGFSEGGR